LKPKILITGGSGLLALNWARCIRSEWDVILGMHARQVSLAGTSSMPIDLTLSDSLTRLLSKLKPDLVIHTVALTDVDRCEQEPELAHYINAELAQNVAQACGWLGIKLVHISTDHLFDGKKAFCTELDAVCPVNIYGKTKALAEELVLGACPEALVVRTNFYGWGSSYRSSFSDGICKSLHAYKKINLFNDIYFSPIIIDELVNSVHELINHRVSGVFNVVGDDRLSKYEFGVSLAKVFDLDPMLIEPIITSDCEVRVLRPKDMSLSNYKLKKILNKNFLDVNHHLHLLKKQYENGVLKEFLNL
jgi:dTDP-4-dehydrorhamnose reductase